MNSEQFEAKMRAGEWFHGLRLLPGAWPVIRVDGCCFTAFTTDRFEKPFDLKFHWHMAKTANVLLQKLQGVYAYTESDEISILLKPDSDLFDRSVEKLVSVSAGIASAEFTVHTGNMPVHFDSRIWLGVNEEAVIDYFRWRQSDAARCCLNGWAYWILRKNGYTARGATGVLNRRGVSFKEELLFNQGININDLPVWQRHGTGVYWERYVKEGYNPLTGEQVATMRRRVKLDLTLPMGMEYTAFLAHLLAEVKERK